MQGTQLGPLYQKAKKGQVKWEGAILVMQKDILCALLGSNPIWVVTRDTSKDLLN